MTVPPAAAMWDFYQERRGLSESEQRLSTAVAGSKTSQAQVTNADTWNCAFYNTHNVVTKPQF
jgi:hypothetical protein